MFLRLSYSHEKWTLQFEDINSYLNPSTYTEKNLLGKGLSHVFKKENKQLRVTLKSVFSKKEVLMFQVDVSTYFYISVIMCFGINFRTLPLNIPNPIFNYLYEWFIRRNYPESTFLYENLKMIITI